VQLVKRHPLLASAFGATITALAIAATLVFAVFPSGAGANHSWNGYHWARTSNPFTIKLGDNVSGLWDGMLVTASNDWTQSTVMNTTIVAGGARPKNCRPTSGRVEVCNASYGNTGWLGVAQIWVSGSHITQGTVKNNDYYFGSSTYQYNNTAEMQHVICQEVGHTFGLAHQDESGISLNTCMDYYHNTSASDTKSTHPNQHDYDELVTIYSHLDSTTTIGSAPAAPASGDLASPSEWGKLVSGSATSGAATYHRDLGHGNAVVTFVIWA
jgi:hypothetical protein